MNKNSEISENKTDTPKLIKADSDDINYQNNVLRLISALGFLGIFGSIICIYMIIMSALSRANHEVDIEPLAETIIALVVCIVGTVIVRLIDKKKRKEFFKNEKKLLDNAGRVKGKVIGVVKNVRRVKYMNDVFDEIIWNFKIEYFDEENNKTVIVDSDRYLNDISAVLAEDSVDVLIKSDGMLCFDGYKLRKNLDEDYVKLNVEEIIQDSKV